MRKRTIGLLAIGALVVLFACPVTWSVVGAMWGQLGPPPKPPRDESAVIAQRIEEALEGYAAEIEVELVLVEQEADYPFAHTYPVWRYHVRYSLLEVPVICESLIDDAAHLTWLGVLPPLAVNESAPMEPETFAQLLGAYAEVEEGRGFGSARPLADWWPTAMTARYGEATCLIEECWVVMPSPDVSSGRHSPVITGGIVYRQVSEPHGFERIGALEEVEGVK